MRNKTKLSRYCRRCRIHITSDYCPRCGKPMEMVPYQDQEHVKHSHEPSLTLYPVSRDMAAARRTKWRQTAGYSEE